jgi:hypothetical protein
VILDDFSHFLWTFPLRLKSDTFTTLTHFFAWVSTQFRRPVRTLQCDNGREFDNHASRSFFLTSGVQLLLSCPYTSAQNGRAERMIRNTTNMIHCLLFQASLPASYWAEALHTATHLLNRLPSKAVSHPTPTSPYTARPPPTTTFVCSAVPAIPTLPLLLLISCLHAPSAASSLATLLTTRGISVLTSPPIASSSLVMSSSTKMCFPLLAPPCPPISTPSVSPIRVPIPPRHLASHRYPHLVQRHRPCLPHAAFMPPLARLPAPRAAPLTLPAPRTAQSTSSAPRVAPSTPPAPRTAPTTPAPSTSGTRFADAAIVYHRRGSAPPSTRTGPGPSTNAS